MKKNRWFPVMLRTGTLALAALSVTLAYSVEHEVPGRSHNSDKPDEAKIKAAMAKLSESDRNAAAAQRYCPVMDTARLGAMGTPIKVMIDGKPVFVCCEHCKEDAVADRKGTLGKAAKLKKATDAISNLPHADQLLVEAQFFCPIEEGSRLGSMGTPVKLMLESKSVYLCCKGCEDSARENSKATLAKVEKIKKDNAKAGHHDDGHDHKHGAAAHEQKKRVTPKK